MVFNLITVRFLPTMYRLFIYNLFTLFDLVFGIRQFKAVCVLCASLYYSVTCTQICTKICNISFGLVHKQHK